MKIYSYANYKGSLKGFQFANISPEGKTESLLMTEMPRDFPKNIRYWCEQKTGWKLILQKINNAKGILLFGRMEQAGDESFFDITLAFSGELKQLRILACIFLENLFNDGGRIIFNETKKAFSKSSDKTKYYVDGNILYKMIRKYLKQLDNTISTRENISSKILNKFKSQFHPVPHIVIPQRKHVPKKERKAQIEQCEQELRSEQEFSESVLLVVTENEIIHPDEVNIYINLSFLI